SQPLGPEDDNTNHPNTHTVAARMLPIPRGLRQDSDDSGAEDSDDTDWDAPAPTVTTSLHTTAFSPPAATPTPAYAAPTPAQPDDQAAPGGGQDGQGSPRSASPPAPTTLSPDALPAGPFTTATLWSNAPALPDFSVITLGNGKTYPMVYPGDRSIAQWTDPYEGVNAYDQDLVTSAQYLSLIAQRAEDVVADANASGVEKMAAERLLETNSLLEADGWLPEYRSEFLRMQMLLGEGDLLDGLPARLESDAGPVWALTDPTDGAPSAQRPVGGSLRGEHGVSSRFHAWVNDNGGDSDWLADWSLGQSGGSIHSSSQYFKVMVSHFRPPREDEGYHMSRLDEQSSLVRSDRWQDEHGRDFPVTTFSPTYVRSMAAQHAFTYEMLRRVQIPNVDAARGVVQLIRLEERSLLGQYNESMPPVGGQIRMKRGPAESYSLLEPYKDPADTDSHMLGPFWVTSQEVPLHRVFGTYLQSRAVPKEEKWSEHTLFLREDENEFLALGEGVSIVYHGTNTPPVLPVTPAPPRTVSARAPLPGQESGGQRQSAASGSGSRGSSGNGRTTLDERIRTAQRLSRAAEAESAHIRRNRPAERQGVRPDEIRAREARRTLEQLRKDKESTGTEPSGTEPASTEPASTGSAGDRSQQSDLARAARARRYAAEKALEEAGRRADELRELLDAARERQLLSARAQRGAAERLAGLAADVNNLRGAVQIDMPTGSLARTPSQWPDPGSWPNPARGHGDDDVRGGGRAVPSSPEESFSATLLRALSRESAPAQDGGGREALNFWLSERISALETEGGVPVPGLPSGDDTADLDEINALGVTLGPGQLAEASMLGGRITLSAAQLDIGQRIGLLVSRAGPGSYPEAMASLAATVSGRNVVIVDQDGIEHSQGTGTGEPVRIVFDGVRYTTPPQLVRET
ncbi:hypothetical protein ACWCPT_17400, partial [Streptomyces sp. NPDC002308]